MGNPPIVIGLPFRHKTEPAIEPRKVLLRADAYRGGWMMLAEIAQTCCDHLTSQARAPPGWGNGYTPDKGRMPPVGPACTQIGGQDTVCVADKQMLTKRIQPIQIGIGGILFNNENILAETQHGIKRRRIEIRKILPAEN